MKRIKSDVLLKKGKHGYEAWQTNKLVAKVSGFDEDAKEQIMRYIPSYENVIENSRQPIVSDMAMKQIEKYYRQGILTKREVIAVLMKENGWSLTEAKQIADYYEKLFNSRQIQSSFPSRGEHNNIYISRKILDDILNKIHFIFDEKYGYKMTFNYDNITAHENVSYAKCYVKGIPCWIYLSNIFDLGKSTSNGTLEISFDETETTKEYEETFDNFLDGLPMEYFDDLHKSFDEYFAWIDNKANEVSDWLVSILPELKIVKSSRKSVTSRFYQNGGDNLYTLSECAQYLAALFFDLRTIHFNATGSEFYTYHSLAQELYEQTEEYYDDIIETSLGYDSNVQPMYVLPGDWNFIDDNGSLSTDGQTVQTLLLDRLMQIYDVLDNVREYDGMVSSKIDSMLEYYDKEIYKLSQALR